MALKEARKVVSVEDIRVIELSDLETQETGKVFVLNTSKGKERGDVILVAGRVSGDSGADTVVIPATWIPIELTTICPLQQLVQSNNLRTTVSRGQLRLLDADDCIEFLRNNEQAQAEMKRLNRYDVVTTGGYSIGTVGDLEVTVGSTGGTTNQEGMTGAVTSFVQLLQFELTQMTEKNEEPSADFITEWTNKFLNLGELTVQEYKHVHTQLRGSIPEIAKLARTAGMKLEGK